MNLHAISSALRKLLPEHGADIDALLDTPEAAAVADRLDEQRVAERRDLLADLAALPAMNEQRLRDAAKRLAAVEAELEAAREKVRQVNEARAAAFAEQVFASVSHEHAMARIERQLIDTADPRLAAMLSVLREVRNKTRNLDRFSVEPSGLGSGKMKLVSNYDQINAALKTIDDASSKIDELQRQALTAREIETILHEVAHQVLTAVRPLGGKGPVLAPTGEVTLGVGPMDPRTGQRTARRAKALPEGLARARAVLDAER